MLYIPAIPDTTDDRNILALKKFPKIDLTLISFALGLLNPFYISVTNAKQSSIAIPPPKIQS